MKKLMSLIVFVLAVSITTQAQERKKRMVKKNPLTAEQQATLAVKKMTLSLDLTDAQAKKIKPLLKKQAEERIAQRKKRMQSRKENAKPSTEKRYKQHNAMLDKRIAFKKSMKKILTEEQFQKFEKQAKHKASKMKHAMAKRKKMQHAKKRKVKKEKSKS